MSRRIFITALVLSILGQASRAQTIAYPQWAAPLQAAGPNTVEQRNGTNPQSFNLYGSYTDASNYERGSMYTDGSGFRIDWQNAGAGSSRAIYLGLNGSRYFGINGTLANWNIPSSGHLLAGADNTFDIGASSGSRPRNIYAAGGVTALNNVTGTWLQTNTGPTTAPGGVAGNQGFAKLGVPAYPESTSQGAGTYAQYNTNLLGKATITSTNAVTFTDAATLTIDGAPVASTNLTIINPWSLYVRTGNAYFGGAITTAGSVVLNSGGNLIATGSVYAAVSTVALLPSCVGQEGARRGVTDATQTMSGNFGATPTGGGANHVPVYCDGSGWKIG